MNEITAAGAVISLLTGAAKLGQTLLDMERSSESKAKLVELYDQILAAQRRAIEAQRAQATLEDEVASLKAELSRLEQHRASKEDYKLQILSSGATVYAPKAEPTAANPNHWLCVECFDRGEAHKLMPQGKDGKSRTQAWKCPKCRNAVNAHWSDGPQKRGQPMVDGTLHA